MRDSTNRSKSSRVGAVIGSIVTVAMLGSACGSGKVHGPSSGAATEVQQSPVRRMQASRIKTYSSIRALAADSAVVVSGSPTGVGTPLLIGDIPFTDQPFKVDAVYKGGVQAGAEILVRQTGDATSDAGLPVMKVGQRYVAFLTNGDFPLEDGTMVKRYYPTGDAGTFTLLDDGSVTKRDTESPKLPSQSSMVEIKAAVRP